LSSSSRKIRPPRVFRSRRLTAWLALLGLVAEGVVEVADRVVAAAGCRSLLPVTAAMAAGVRPACNQVGVLRLLLGQHT
jgi:hypothetical protein